MTLGATNIKALSFAKVNLHLEVLSQREDGFHEIESILQTIELHDVLHLEVTDGPIRVLCEHPSVPVDRSNLCHRAAKLLRMRLGLKKGAEIRLEKRIPVAAGLGGGSSNAAACLLALPRIWGVDVEDELLVEVAERLGSDVPFFLRGGTQLARGRGTDLTPLHSSGEGWYLVVTPKLELSTADVYSQLRMGLTRIPPKVNLQSYKALLSRFPERTWPGSNRLGDVVLPGRPALRRLLDELEATEPRLALLSGSGPSLFAVYSEREQAEVARTSIDIADGFTWVGRSVREGVKLVD